MHERKRHKHSSEWDIQTYIIVAGLWIALLCFLVWVLVDLNTPEPPFPGRQ
jgi:hypothetical protein